MSAPFEGSASSAGQRAFGGLELWCVDLRAAAGALAAIEAVTPRLSIEEQARASAMADADAAQDWSAAHVALRILIERVAGPEWRGRAFDRGPARKPRLAGAPVDFSLSHASRWALIGVATQGPIGVDLESERVVQMSPARRRSTEAAAAALCPNQALPEVGDARLLQSWVRLEALAKATGLGIGALLTQLGLTARPGARDVETLTARIGDLRATHPPFVVGDLRLGERLFGAAVTPPDTQSPEVLGFPNARAEIEALASL